MAKKAKKKESPYFEYLKANAGFLNTKPRKTPTPYVQSDTLAEDGRMDSALEKIRDYKKLSSSDRAYVDEQFPKEKFVFPSDEFSFGISALAALVPGQGIHRPELEVLESYNPNMYGTGSQALMEAGGKIKANAGFNGDPNPKKRLVGDDYYGASATLSHYKNILNDKLKAKNPEGFANYFKGLVDLRRGGKTQDADKYVQEADYNDYLSPDEVQETLGADNYQRYLDSLKQVNQYNVQQGRQPLYGEIEGENDVTALNYGRRFASLQVTPSQSIYNKTRKTNYSRKATFNPETMDVDFTEEGDLSLRPPAIEEKPTPALASMKSGGTIKRRSSNMFDGGTVEFIGDSHEEGGIDLDLGNKTIEVEGQETAITDSEGNVTIMGNMYVPGSKSKFKTVSKKIAEKENKYTSMMNKGSELVLEADTRNKFERLKLNSGQLMMDGGKIGQKDLSMKKQHLASLQQSMLETAEEFNLDPIALSEGTEKKAKKGTFQKAEAGFTNDGEGDPFLEMIKRAIGKAESGNDYFVPAQGGSSAFGKYQFVKGTRKAIWERNFKGKYKTFDEFDAAFKTTPELQEATMDAHINGLRKKYGDDVEAIALVHRMGEGGYNKIKNNPSLLQKSVKTSVPSSNDTETPAEYLKKITDTPTATVKGTEIPVVAPKVKAPPAPKYGLPNPDINFTPDQENPNRPVAPTPEMGVARPSSRPATGSNVQKMSILQILPELIALGSNVEEPVQLRQYTPDLFSPYEVTMDDRRADNRSTFNALQAQVGDNPTALATLAAQKYAADNQVGAEEFRINQGIDNEVTNKNVALLNDAELKNLGLMDEQYVRQSTAKSKTKAQNHMIASSLASKYTSHLAENRKLAIYENLYDFRFVDSNKDGINDLAEYQGPDANINFGEIGTAATPIDPYVSTRTINSNTGRRSVLQNIPSEKEKEAIDLRNARERNRMPIFRNFNLNLRGL